MAAVRARCQLCRKVRAIETVTIYIAPATISQMRVCGECKRLVEQDRAERKVVRK